MTTFAVTTMQAGSFEAVHAIVPVAQIRFNFRSNSQEELEKLRKKIFDAIDEACKEETERWGMDTITYDVKHICDVNAGHQDAHAPIVEGAMAAAEYLGRSLETVVPQTATVLSKQDSRQCASAWARIMISMRICFLSSLRSRVHIRVASRHCCLRCSARAWMMWRALSRNSRTK